MLYVYDGSFTGLLTTVFQVYDRRDKEPEIITDALQTGLWDEKIEVTSDVKLAERVMNGFLKKANPQAARDFYAAFLSENNKVTNDMIGYMQYVFSSNRKVTTNYANRNVLSITEAAKKVYRERHRMEAFVRFKLTTDSIYFATITPDFNVLPLLVNHFTKRYADQQWIIYDLKREYGLYYDLTKTEMIELDLKKELLSAASTFHEDEQGYQDLWKDYFKSTNIASRVNRKLHLRHVPLRYWKYLVEKGG